MSLSRHYSQKLGPNERVLALIFDQPKPLSDLAGKLLSVYPRENISQEQHRLLPFKVRAISCLGVWCDELSSQLAYRKAWLRRKRK